MIIETYDPVSGKPVQRTPVISLNEALQGQHTQPVVFRCLRDTESSLNAISVVLSDGGFTDNIYGFFTNSTFISNVSSSIQTFTPMTISSPQTIPISDASGIASDYSWIDIKASSNSTGPSKASFTLSYTFSN